MKMLFSNIEKSYFSDIGGARFSLAAYVLEDFKSNGHYKKFIDNPSTRRHIDCLKKNIKTYKKYIRLELYNFDEDDDNYVSQDEIDDLNTALSYLSKNGQHPPISLFEKAVAIMVEKWDVQGGDVLHYERGIRDIIMNFYKKECKSKDIQLIDFITKKKLPEGPVDLISKYTGIMKTKATKKVKQRACSQLNPTPPCNSSTHKEKLKTFKDGTSVTCCYRK
jgi:hypothetical protein